MYNSIKPILKRKQILVRCTGVIWPLERDDPGVCLRVIPTPWCYGPHQESPLRWQSEGGNLGEAALYPRSTMDFCVVADDEDRVFCSQGWPPKHSAAEDDLELPYLPAQTSQVLPLQAGATMPGLCGAGN